jgi:hypothetical protein
MKTVNKMRLSKETLSILKNFATINSNILIKPGNVIKTISIGQNILAEVVVQEDFDTEIPIWDLNKFLGVVSMFSNPDLEFTDTYVDISNGKSTVRYYYSEPSLLTVPKRNVAMPKTTISFDLNEHNLNEMLKAASILQVSDVKINTEDNELKIVIADNSVKSSNSFSIVIEENYSGPEYSGNFDISEIKFFPGSYKVELTDSVISKFTHQTLNLSYYVAIQRD